MSGGGGDQTISTSAPIIGSLRVQTSAFGRAIPWVFGRARVAGNLLWYGDFTAIPHTSTSTSGGSGGKGGGGGSVTVSNTTYTYTAAALLLLCRGAIQGLGGVWSGKALGTAGSLGFKAGGAGWSIYNGDGAQTAFPYLTTHHPDQALAYRRRAYVASGALDLGDNAALPNYSFEIQATPIWGPAIEADPSLYATLMVLSMLFGFQWAPPAGVIIDASPKDVLNTMLTEALGWGAGQIGDLTDFATACRASGLFISPAYVDQEPVQAIVDRLMQIGNAAPVWSEDKLKIVPLFDAAVTGNGVTYTPALTPQYDLGDGDFIHADGEDPVIVHRSTPADAFNQVTVKFFNRANQYNEEPAVAQDAAAIELYGLKPMPPVTLHEICDGAVAQRVADLLLRAELYAERNLYEFRLGWKYSRLEPTDIVTLTDAGLACDRLPVRLWTSEENGGKNGEGGFTWQAKEFPAASGTPAVYGRQAGAGAQTDFNADPGNCNAPAFIEAPAVLAGGALELWMAVSGASAIWGGCDVWISEDNATYRKLGTIYGKARMGVLSAALASGADPDTVNTAHADLTESGGTLTSGTRADADGLNTLCWVDGELIAYQTATLTATAKYDLTYLRRGAYNTAIAAHPAGSQFARMDAAVEQARYGFDGAKVGKNLWVKLPSFNIYGGGAQDLASVQPFQYTLRGTALLSPIANVQNVATKFSAGNTVIFWDAVADFRPIDYEVRLGATFASAKVLGRTPLAEIAAHGDGTYWIAGHYTAPDGSDIYSAAAASIALSGSILTKNVIASWDEAALGWTGTLTPSAMKSGANIVLDATGDILSNADFLNIADLLHYGGIASSGAYTIPSAHRVDIGRVAPCGVLVSYTLVGVNVNDNVLTAPDFLGIADLLGSANGARVNAVPQIRLAGDDAVWGAWQNYAPVQYNARHFDGRILLASSDAQVYPLLSGYSFGVDVPDRSESFTNVALAGGGTTLTYSKPFNGGPGAAATPNVQVTIRNAQAGDDVVRSAESLTGLTLQIMNGGSGVARNADIQALGY